jgi:putative acid phosphatase of HAD superfamily subfamily IIIB
MLHPTRAVKTTAALAGLGLAVALGTLTGSTATGSQAQQHVTSKQIPNLGIVKNQIKAYYGDTGGKEPTVGSDFWAEVTSVEGKALKTLPRVIKHADDDPVLVLDVDDTTLSTYNYEVTHDFGYDPVENAEYIHDHGMGPVFGMVSFTQFAASKDVTVYYITGRPESQRADTERDLLAAGYPNVSDDTVFLRNKDNPPAYLPCEPTCTTIEYKSLTRQHIESLGYDVVMDMGDQYSDLEGGFTDSTVKLPNPMYYLP